MKDHFRKERLMEQKRRKYLAIPILLLVAALISFAVIAPWASSPEHQAGYIDTLDNKKTQVQELAAAATATSIAVSMLPGDAATPIANKLADMSQYLLIVLCAIYLEKYLVTVMGLVAFRYLLPVSLLVFLIGHLGGWTWLKTLSVRVILTGLALFFVIPVSLHITSIIETTYASSIETSLESAEQSAVLIGGSAEADAESESAGNQTDTAKTENSEDSQSFLDKVRNFPSTIADTASEVVSSVSQLSEEKIKEMETAVNHFMESVAVMLITSCVIPILVLLFFFMVIKNTLDGRILFYDSRYMGRRAPREP